MSNANWKFTLGVITGAVAGILIYKNRRHIGRALSDLGDDLMDMKDKAVHSMEQLKDAAMGKAEQVKERVQERVQGKA